MVVQATPAAGKAGQTATPADASRIAQGVYRRSLRRRRRTGNELTDAGSALGVALGLAVIELIGKAEGLALEAATLAGNQRELAHERRVGVGRQRQAFRQHCVVMIEAKHLA